MHSLDKIFIYSLIIYRACQVGMEILKREDGTASEAIAAAIRHLEVFYYEPSLK
jgi:hypothetical protein